MTYQSVVLADSPTLLWMQQETSGTSAADATGNGNTGTYTGGFTLAQPGPSGVGSDSVLYNGTTGLISGPSAGTSPDVFSIETWFKTTSTGPLGGFSAGPGLGNGTYDRMLYINSSGKLAIYVYNVTYTDPVSAATANDGNWHYACATLDVSGNLKVYLDNASPVTATGYTNIVNYSGHWLAGGDTGGATGGGTAGSTNGINGDMAAFAVYPAALSSTQTTNHYNAATGGGSSPLAPPLLISQAVKRAAFY